MLLKYRFIVVYGLTMAVLVFALKWLQWKYLVVDLSLEMYIGLIAVIFTILGIWVATQLVKPRVHTLVVEKVVEKEVYVPRPSEAEVDEAALKKLNLTTREYEVLQLLTKGYSNAEIAAQLCLSLSTVKTHVSNLLFKMDVKSRAQAIEKAKRLRLTP